jgi:hypothetical protein
MERKHEAGERIAGIAKSRLRLLSILLFLCAAALAACEPQTPPDTAPAPEAEGTEDTETSFAYRALFPAGADAAEIERMLTEYAAAGGARIEAVFADESDDAAQYLGRDDAPLVFAVRDRDEAAPLLEGGWLLDLAAVENDEMRRWADAVPTPFRLSEQGAFGLPADIHGCGLAADTEMIAGFFGADKTDDFLADCGAATYEEWAVMIENMDRYLREPSSERIYLNGRSYRFLPEKSPTLQGLTGIFALSGVETKRYADIPLNAALSCVWPDAASLLASEAAFSWADMEPLRAAFAAYAETLDLFTSYLAGLYSAGVRGPDFVLSANYSQAQARRAFMEGKAVFTICDSGDYADLKALNAEKALRLRFFPIKVPHADPQTAEGAAFVNASLPMGVSWYFCVNAQAEPALQDMGVAFLLWQRAWTAQTGSPLARSLSVYAGRGGILGFPADALPAAWRRAALGEDGIRIWLQKRNWLEADKTGLTDFLTGAWAEALDLEPPPDEAAQTTPAAVSAPQETDRDV